MRFFFILESFGTKASKCFRFPFLAPFLAGLTSHEGRCLPSKSENSSETVSFPCDDSFEFRFILLFVFSFLGTLLKVPKEKFL